MSILVYRIWPTLAHFRLVALKKHLFPAFGLGRAITALNNRDHFGRNRHDGYI